MRNTNKAFTLVELIVVITILAILGTIAFISLQGYSADARNSKRTSDLGNIQSAMSLKSVEGVPLMSFIATTSNDGTVDLAGRTGISAGTTYNAGTPSYTVLNVNEKDFKDPNDKEYRIGATTYKAGSFQLTATMEIDGVDTAQVNGTYVARGSGSVSATGVDGDTMTLADAAANTFKKGDIVSFSSGGTGTGEIQKVSRDGVTLTLNSGAATGELVALNANEADGLIFDEETTNTAETGAITNNQSLRLAY